jgi:hypothetical protein
MTPMDRPMHRGMSDKRLQTTVPQRFTGVTGVVNKSSSKASSTAPWASRGRPHLECFKNGEKGHSERNWSQPEAVRMY